MALSGLLSGVRYLLVTSQGWRRRGAVERIIEACGKPVAVIDQIAENPTLQNLSSLDPLVTDIGVSPGIVVALGGGSVMDAAKAIASALAPGADMGVVDAAARADCGLPQDLAPWPVYCVPTTAGTGSEVTSTATLWDAETGAKYSLADQRLYPRAAVLDPALLATAPSALMLSNGLDALSHAMESMWSARHNPFSDTFAVAAILRIRRHLPTAVQQDQLRSRAELQIAAMLSGLAISATRTALAHSISYPLTGRFGLRHGLACSFTLPSVAAFTLEGSPERARLIADAFGVADTAELSRTLRAWLEELGVYDAVRRVIGADDVAELGESLLTTSRADNSLRAATPADAQAILRDALSEQQEALTGPMVTERAGRVIWITGLSGVGKSTLARAVTDRLRALGRQVIRLDGDELRSMFRATGYSEAERREMAGRYSRLCQMLAAQGTDIVCATMSLFHECQRWNREHIPNYFEVYLKVDPAVLISRDVEGLYSRAARGEVSNVAGVDLPYEEPESPDVVIDRNDDDRDIRTAVSAAASQVLACLSRGG